MVQRQQFAKYVDAYFDTDPEWRALLDQHLEPLPFNTVYKWILRTKCSVEKGTRVAKKALPLVGDLLAYLLTADLTYAGQVAQPNVQTIGDAISKLRKKGAWSGLHQAKQLLAASPSSQEVKTAFCRVYEFLDSHLTPNEQDLIQFDPIMVEHTLCKYQQLMRELKGTCGQGEF
ncbi:hypothetical protein GSI_14994 [Ganoderma sinense ZZ0214-1]|uniref:Uncharacterized protein n=1 Tax=Ganoderma sinense ZZ0214-1 TaxID=1077348 RepID=A0A2G8RLA1_9APHY|nr:hypothetical protein GSI_14994 [Ganoderma sinense ZZ0214-1]